MIKNRGSQGPPTAIKPMMMIIIIKNTVHIKYSQALPSDGDTFWEMCGQAI